jgi:hypothetical protein
MQLAELNRLPNFQLPSRMRVDLCNTDSSGYIDDTSSMHTTTVQQSKHHNLSERELPRWVWFRVHASSTYSNGDSYPSCRSQLLRAHTTERHEV